MKDSASRTLPCGRKIAGHRSNLSEKKLALWKQQLETYLDKNGLRSTGQRWKLAQLILSAGGHLTAQELIEKVRKRHPEIGPATVYRNLKVLCDAAILKESLTDAEGRIIYELYEEAHHDHIVCMDCGEIFEFHSDAIEAEQARITEKLQFSQMRHRHVIYARCRYRGR